MSDDYTRPDSLAWQEIPQAPAHQLASHTLGHPFLYGILIEHFRPGYRVAGRRWDGTIAGEHRLRWLLGRILLPVRGLVLSIMELVLDTSTDSNRRRSVVTGPPDTAALPFADTHNQHAGQPVWLLWSPHRAVLVHITEQQPPQLDLLWSSEGKTKPFVDTPNAILRWPDGSSIQLHLNNTDRELLAKQRSI